MSYSALDFIKEAAGQEEKKPSRAKRVAKGVAAAGTLTGAGLLARKAYTGGALGQAKSDLRVAKDLGMGLKDQVGQSARGFLQGVQRGTIR